MPPAPQAKKIFRTVGFVLAGLGVFACGATLYMWFGVLKPYAAGLERPRVPLLKKVAAAQTTFCDGDLDKDGIRDFASLKELVRAKLLTDREVHIAGFVFIEPATSDPSNRWWAVAQPLHPFQGRSFFVNHTGIIYYSTASPWDLESRINRITAQVPSGAHPVTEP
jgi:hypothetical protein